VKSEKPLPPEISPQTKRTWRPVREDHSAGGVAYRRTETGQLELALIATHGGSRWQLPKGSVEPGEVAQETAIREVEEEAGLTTAYEHFLKTIDYWYWDTYRKTTPELVHKRVDFFLLRVVGGELSDSSYEVDGVGWFSPEQALAVLTFAGEQEVVRLALDKLAAR
jgi:diadenosine hexaphosphate hydrolase (ATP-forming)